MILAVTKIKIPRGLWFHDHAVRFSLDFISESAQMVDA